MGSTPRRLKNFPARKGSPSSHYTRSKHHNHHNKKSTITTTSSSVSEKLEALKNLIPVQETAAASTGDVATSDADQLFQETADYILLLQTQVSVLQKLVDFYGSVQQQ